jgi:redox-sensitive bicupin YhaK (pirin superfamily)
MIEYVIEGHRRDLGGFEVNRILPSAQKRAVGPFVFYDHMGPVDLAPNVPRSMDVRPHPHIGLATVTYLFDGKITHRDSLGFRQIIVPGEVNWMTAGRGISHSERFEEMRERGGLLHGIQAWVGLPEADEEREPAFHHVDSAELPTGQSSGVHWRLIAGRAFGAASPVKTFSPLLYVAMELEVGARSEIPDEADERAIYVASGTIEVDGREFAPGQMPVLAPGSRPALIAKTQSQVMILGGEPLGPRHVWWNFVSSRKERIEEAKADWQAGRIPLPVGDDKEFIPLPAAPRPSPEPMS